MTHKLLVWYISTIELSPTFPQHNNHLFEMDSFALYNPSWVSTLKFSQTFLRSSKSKFCSNSFISDLMCQCQSVISYVQFLLAHLSSINRGQTALGPYTFMTHNSDGTFLCPCKWRWWKGFRDIRSRASRWQRGRNRVRANHLWRQIYEKTQWGRATFEKRINSQSLEDAQVEYIYIHLR